MILTPPYPTSLPPQHPSYVPFAPKVQHVTGRRSRAGSLTEAEIAAITVAAKAAVEVCVCICVCVRTYIPWPYAPAYVAYMRALWCG